MDIKPSHIIPALEWIPGYKIQNLRGDLTAGVTTAVMLIPQSMAYALLAGLPPVIGLYTSIVPLLVYALLGTSRQLAVGPVAMVALLVSSGIGALSDPGDLETYVRLTIMLTFMVGILQFSMGIFRLGFLTNFMSHPVISGFTSAAALIIGFSQLKHVLGVNLTRSQNIWKIFYQAIQEVDQINPYTLCLGLATIAFLLVIKRVNRLIPGALIIVIVSCLVTWGWDLQQMGVKIVAEIPRGLPPIRLPVIDITDVTALLPIALTISFVGFMESIAVGKKIATEKHYELDANKELIALGAANFSGAFFQAMPIAGSFSRTAVNNEARASTGLAGIITAIVIGIVLLFFTPLLYFLPNAVLAGIIMVAVYRLMDFREVSFLWKVKRDDLALLIITFAATIGLGVIEGIFVGMGVSMVWFVIKTTRPHYAVLGKLPGRTDYCNVKRHQTESTGNILVIRFDAQFYYGNVSFLKETLIKAEAEMETVLKGVVIDASSINQLDSSAVQALQEIMQDYRNRGCKLLFANIKGPVLDVMKRSGFHENLGVDCCYRNVHEAVCSIPDNS